MEDKNNNAFSFVTEHPKLFISTLILFLFSLGLIIFGYFNPSQNKDGIINENLEKEKNEEVSVSEYFKDGFSSSGSLDKDTEFLEKDPFKETCAETSGDNLPSIKNGTVCLR